METGGVVSSILGKQVTLPLLFFVLGLLYQDFVGKRVVISTTADIREGHEDDAQGKLKDRAKWQPAPSMLENVIPIEQDEKADYKPWDETDPYPYKPFKPGEHRLTMGVSTIPVKDWIVLENTYKSRIEAKWEIIKSEYKDVIYHLDPVMINRDTDDSQIDKESYDSEIVIRSEDVEQADRGVCETYKNLVSYLACRFPQYFKVLIEPSDKFPGVFYNSIMQEYHPVDASLYMQLGAKDPQGYMFKCYETDIVPSELTTEWTGKLRDEIGFLPVISCEKTRRAHELVLSMARLVEDDLLLLSKTACRQFKGEYVLFSGLFAFAAGFNPRNRFLKPLTLIHGPVPEYKRDLRDQMNNFFQTLKIDKLVRRVNYTFQNHDMLYVQSKFTDSRARSLKELHGGRDLHYRSERQTLIKFDTKDGTGSGCVVFGVKTYLWNFKDQFLVNNFYSQPNVLEDLERAVEDMNGVLGDYKGRSEWGAALLEVLRANKKKHRLS